MATLMIAGDSFEHQMDIKEGPKGGALSAVAIASSSTVKAALTDIDGTVLISPTTVDEATPGSDWQNGTIVVEFTSAQTDFSPVPNLVRLEVQVTTSVLAKTTYFSDWFEVQASAF